MAEPPNFVKNMKFFNRSLYPFLLLLLATILVVSLYLKDYLTTSLKSKDTRMSLGNLAGENRTLSGAELDQHIVALQTLAVKQNSKAINELIMLADNGNANAQSKLAMLYEKGNGVAKDIKRAIELYHRSSEQGNLVAALNLGHYYEFGIEVKQDFTKAFELYTAAAASQDNSLKSLAQFNLANLYRQGLGVEQNIEKAISLFESVVQGVDAPSKEQSPLHKEIQAGALTALGHLSRALHDFDKARNYYIAASKLGNITAKTNLGYDYLVGNGVPKDIPQAIELLSYAAERGEPAAQTNLGICYLNGVGVANDIQKATVLFQSAAASGDVKAKEILKQLK